MKQKQIKLLEETDQIKIIKKVYIHPDLNSSFHFFARSGKWFYNIIFISALK